MDIQLLTDVEKASIGERQPLPERYLGLSDDEMDERIGAAKRTLGERVVILGHHYQRDEVIKFADYTGDSLKLSRAAASRGRAEYIVFCGVHFMAESADILRGPHQKVVLPDLAAGCSMADMAAPDQLEICWRELREMGLDTLARTDGRLGVLPVTYINSSAAVKAFVGRHGGVVCTSSNAASVMTLARERGEKLLMLPDEHLGRNTGYKLGIPLEQMVVWDPNEVRGGLQPEAVKAAKLILWKGHCSVHTRFTVPQIQAFRKKYPAGKVVAHPECTFDVVRAADESGSTEYILGTVRNSPPGSIWAVATEIHLVNRLMHEVAPDKTVVTLDPFGCLCSTMFRVSPNHLLWVLEGLVEGKIYNQIVVPDDDKRDAKLALDRMLQVV
ncbi:MAG: quinolinate synthetase [Acidobacteria bacterium RIFCSPLOWO2_02_FULL_67_36]|nr:MAG: quinolinate synthetase [Acidobacteria bacterium RIFCSPLOWO2_02_FULL_67_36]